MKVAVGTTIAGRPPHRSARALISACGSYRRLVTATGDTQGSKYNAFIVVEQLM
jgi:hypothetical protein